MSQINPDKRIIPLPLQQDVQGGLLPEDWLTQLGHIIGSNDGHHL